ncbi:hypothetical protein [Kitasatospora cineracea]|uniref:hypothetical protein n=1 Tax=Kitasatospora cineracea TaxID=88074 RepID=UPI0037986835
MSASSRSRRAAAGAAAITLLSTAGLFVVGTASARADALLDVTCTPPSHSTTTYSPPLTATPQPVSGSVVTDWSSCLSASTPGLTSGTSTGTLATVARSCLSLLTPGTDTLTITWNTGASSTLTLKRTSTIAGASLITTLTGTVASGLFAGDTVAGTVVGPATDITLCTLGLGTVSTLNSLVTIEITSP